MKVLEMRSLDVLREKVVKNGKVIMVQKSKNNIIIEEGKGKLLSPFNFLR